MKYDVFISYRREGGYDTAKHLNDLLVRDGYRVSFDIDTLRNGDFDVQLLERIEECKDFILVVDKHAFDRTLDPDFDPQKDWLRCELAHALKHNKNIMALAVRCLLCRFTNLLTESDFMKKRLLTGLKPSGELTLGSYIGGIKQTVKYQDKYDSFIFVADFTEYINNNIL